MPSDSGDHRRTTKPQQVAAGAPLSEPQHLPCPRCDSTNTKFCYYNNYNFSQPRHFCKACRRYWTHGGTLRDIPIGGATRKNNSKRSRLTTPTLHNSLVSSPLDYRHMASATATAFLIPFAGENGGALQLTGDAKPVVGSFTSLLSSAHGPGLFGVGAGGFEDVSFGLGRSIWPFSGGGAAVGGGNTWEVESGGGGGDCFGLPDLAISTPGNGMK